MVIRRIDAEATALQRQGELALWPPLLGQEASQIGSARALRDDDFVFPSYRDNGVAYCRGVNPEDIVRAWRGNASAGWDPYTVNVATQQIIIGAQTLHATGLRHGHPERRRRLRRRRLLRRRRHERRRRQRSHGLRRELPGARRLLLPEQPLGHLRTRPAAVPHPARGPRLRLRHPQHAGRRQRRPGRHGSHPHCPGPGTPRRRPHLHRGRHLPDGPAHDGGRPHPLPGRQRARGLGRQGPDRPDEVAARAQGTADRGPRGRRRRARPTQWPRNCAPAPSTCPSPQPLDIFKHVYSTPNSWLDRQQDHYSRYLASFGDPAEAASEEGAR